MRVNFNSRCVRIGFLTVLSLFILINFGQNSYAQSVTFGQVISQFGGQDFRFVNNTTSGTFETIPGGTQVFFRYFNIPGLDAQLTGFQDAVFTITTTTTTSSNINVGTINQPLDGVTTLVVTRTTPATVGSGSRTNLLTAVFSNNSALPQLSGNLGGGEATLSATTPNQIVTFTSDFIVFGATTGRNLSLSFSSVVPGLSQGPGSFLNNFAAAGTGTFASNPAPTPYFPPTAASVSVTGRVYNSYGRGQARATVELVGPDGAVRRATTGSFGYYRFDDVDAGEFYIFNVRAKGQTFSTELLMVTDDVVGLDFFASPQ